MWWSPGGHTAFAEGSPGDASCVCGERLRKYLSPFCCPDFSGRTSKGATSPEQRVWKSKLAYKGTEALETVTFTIYCQCSRA